MMQNRKICRGGQACRPESLAEAIGCAVFHSEPEAKDVAARLGVRYAYLAAAADPQRADTQFQARHLIRLFEVTRNLTPLRFLAHHSACAVVPLPDVTSGDGSAVYESFTSTVTKLGRVGEGIQTSLADGKVTAVEAFSVTRAIDDTIDELLNARAAVLTKALGKSSAVKMALERADLPHRRRA